MKTINDNTQQWVDDTDVKQQAADEVPADDNTEPQKKRSTWRVVLLSPILIIIPIVVYLFFYSQHNYAVQTENQDKIDELKSEIKLNRDSTIIYEQRAAALNTDKERMEKIAREQYGMKRDNEEVFITDIK